MCTPTNADKLLDLSRLAEKLADHFANRTTHPALWELYRRNAHNCLLENMTGQPLPEVVRG